MSKLKNKSIKAISAENENQVLYNWSAQKCLIAEIEYEDNSYCLNNSKWYQIDHSFETQIKDEYLTIPIYETELLKHKSNGRVLFNKRLLQTHLNNFDYPSDFDYEKSQYTISLWQKSVRNGNYDKTKETQVQSKFLTKFFNEILGYNEMQDNPDEWFLINEAKTEVDSTKADGALGYFTKEHHNDITRAVIELKDANTPLDKKQSSRKDYDSPVSQAFSYSSKFDRCDWIIVSNFKEIRLYNKERGQGYYESFEVLNLNDEKEFKRFYFCLCKQNLLDKNRNSLLDNLVKDTSKNEEEISKDFYKDFKALRKSLFEHICENNPKYVLALLNSKLLQYYYSNIAQEDGRAFAEVKPANIKRLPIPNTTFAQKQNLKLQSEQMIKLNKQFHEEIDSALELIKSEYQPKKISQNLEKFYTLGIHPFLEELEKQKVKLSLNQKEELIKWYQDKSKVLDDIKKQIDTLDQQIDQEVYKLYNLTDEEIKIIEEG